MSVSSGQIEAVSKVVSRVVHLPVADIDTDQIIPGRYISSRTDEEFAHALFRARRDNDPDFVLNDPRMAARNIMLVGRNFGCGSSREAAPWALKAGGFRAIVGPSFGDIFEGNAVRSGIVLAKLSEDACEELAGVALGEEEREVVVDLQELLVSVPGTGFAVDFGFDPFYRELLLGGLTELDYLLDRLPAVERYELSSRMNADALRRG